MLSRYIGYFPRNFNRLDLCPLGRIPQLLLLLLHQPIKRPFEAAALLTLNACHLGLVDFQLVDGPSLVFQRTNFLNSFRRLHTV